jgi:hypothetical protein
MPKVRLIEKPVGLTKPGKTQSDWFLWWWIIVLKHFLCQYTCPVTFIRLGILRLLNCVTGNIDVKKGRMLAALSKKLWADGWDFSLPKVMTGCHLASRSVLKGHSFPLDKLSRACSWPFSSTGVEVENEWRCSPTLICLCGMHGESFTVTCVLDLASSKIL